MLYGYVFDLGLMFGDSIWCEYDSYYYEIHDYMEINYVLMVWIVDIIGG